MPYEIRIVALSVLPLSMAKMHTVWCQAIALSIPALSIVTFESIHSKAGPPS
jgi:hypothetical protein